MMLVKVIIFLGLIVCCCLAVANLFFVTNWSSADYLLCLTLVGFLLKMLDSKK